MLLLWLYRWNVFTQNLYEHIQVKGFADVVIEALTLVVLIDVVIAAQCNDRQVREALLI